MDECYFKLEENTSAEIRLSSGEKSEDYTDYLPRRTHAITMYRLLHLLQGVDEDLNWRGLLSRLNRGCRTAVPVGRPVTAVTRQLAAGSGQWSHPPLQRCEGAPQQI